MWTRTTNAKKKIIFLDKKNGQSRRISTVEIDHISLDMDTEGKGEEDSKTKDKEDRETEYNIKAKMIFLDKKNSQSRRIKTVEIDHKRLAMDTKDKGEEDS